MNERALTHEDMFIQLLESMNSLTQEIKDKNKQLKKDKDYDSITQLHKTKVIIRRWFFDQGGLLL